VTAHGQAHSQLYNRTHEDKINARLVNRKLKIQISQAVFNLEFANKKNKKVNKKSTREV
jgi:hypothetical protein